MAYGSTNWSLHEHDSHRIHRALHAYLYEVSARCVLLVDRSGQLITAVGERPKFDTTAFASLAAADFAANDQLASMIGEREFSSLFHQGQKESMYLADVVHRVILIVLFDKRTTLGLVRIRAKSVVLTLGDIFREVLNRAAIRSSAPFLEGALVDEVEDEIDRLFGGR